MKGDLSHTSKHTKYIRLSLEVHQWGKNQEGLFRCEPWLCCLRSGNFAPFVEILLQLDHTSAEGIVRHEVEWCMDCNPYPCFVTQCNRNLDHLHLKEGRKNINSMLQEVEEIAYWG